MSFIVLPGNRPTIDRDVNSAPLRYGVDVADVLATGDTLSSVSATASGVTLGAVSFSGTVIQAPVSGGTDGATASVTFAWLTAAGDVDQRTIYLACKQR